MMIYQSFPTKNGDFQEFCWRSQRVVRVGTIPNEFRRRRRRLSRGILHEENGAPILRGERKWGTLRKQQERTITVENHNV